MRLITDEQHAQIVEGFGIVFKCRPLGYETMTQIREDKIRAALAVLQALPEVEVVGYEVWHAMSEPELSYNKGGIKSLMKKLYATKEPS